jgi:hypothetical protein
MYCTVYNIDQSLVPARGFFLFMEREINRQTEREGERQTERGRGGRYAGCWGGGTPDWGEEEREGGRRGGGGGRQEVNGSELKQSFIGIQDWNMEYRGG